MNFKQYHYPQGISLRSMYNSMNGEGIYQNLQNREKNSPRFTPIGQAHITHVVAISV